MMAPVCSKHFQPTGTLRLNTDVDTVWPPEHDGSVPLVVVILVVVDACGADEVDFAAGPDEVVSAVVDAVVEDEARLPVATGAVGCWATVAAALGSAVQAAGIAD
jgi:hypothetical protein